jgi:hypothetical protein
VFKTFSVFRFCFTSLCPSFQQTIEAWNKVFYLAAGIYVFGCILFVVFGRTSVQPWNTYWEIKKDSNKEQPDDQTPLLEQK